VPPPPFTASGDLPPSVHRATLSETLERIGRGSPQRMQVGLRLERIFNVARATGHLARCVVLGSSVTAKPAPNDVDVFLLVFRQLRTRSSSQARVALLPPLIVC
jgi:hypothetical protein